MTPPFILHDCVQGTSEWHALRAGRATSSEAEHIVPLSVLYPKDKGIRDNAKGRKGYQIQLARERRTGRPEVSRFTTEAMSRGRLLEPEARGIYAQRHPELDVREVGFISDPSRRIGTSPDALCYVDGTPLGGLEIKCPEDESYWECVFDPWDDESQPPRRKTTIPRRYMRQVLHHLLVSGAEWWDLAVYHPEFPEELSWHEIRLTRETAQPQLDIYAKALETFLGEVDRLECMMRMAI